MASSAKLLRKGFHNKLFIKAGLKVLPTMNSHMNFPDYRWRGN